jgi:hypothetical protein
MRLGFLFTHVNRTSGRREKYTNVTLLISGDFDLEHICIKTPFTPREEIQRPSRSGYHIRCASEPEDLAVSYKRSLPATRSNPDFQLGHTLRIERAFC